MSVVSERLTGFAGTHNIVSQKEVSTKIFNTLGLIAGDRSWCVRMQPTTTKSQFSDKGKRTRDRGENKVYTLNVAVIVIEGIIHTKGFLW